MSGAERDIRIISVDKKAIQESSEHKGIWIVPFRLSAIPDESWARNFYDIHKKNAGDMKRKANVTDDCILVCVADTDDLQKVLDALKIDLKDTNAVCEVVYQKKLQLQQDLVDLRKKSEETAEKLKRNCDNLKF